MTKLNLGTQWNGHEESAATGNTKGRVVLSIDDFSIGDGWHVSMSPDTARELADALRREADEAVLEDALTEEDIYAAVER